MLLINDLELVDTPDHFETRLKAGGVLDVAEKYPWTGEEVLEGFTLFNLRLVVGCHQPTSSL